MDNQPVFNNKIPWVFYIAGLILGLALTFAATWADLEAAFYGFDRVGGERLGSLNCPILMGANETSSFSIAITNSTERKVSPTIKTDVSTRAVPASTFNPITVEAGETKKMEWAIGPENIDLGRFIFVRAWMYAGYPLKDRENTCGVLVLPIPGSGTAYTWGITVLSILGMGSGLYLINRSQKLNARKKMEFVRLMFMTVIVAAGLIVSFSGVWLLAILLLAVALLMCVISLGSMVRA